MIWKLFSKHKPKTSGYYRVELITRAFNNADLEAYGYYDAEKELFKYASRKNFSDRFRVIGWRPLTKKELPKALAQEI